MEHLKIINNIAEEIENKINKAMENKYLINLFALQKSLVYYQNAITSNGVLLAKLKNNVVKLGFNQEELELLDDILIENDQCYRQAEVYSNILASLMDARASIVSNNLNILMKTPEHHHHNDHDADPDRVHLLDERSAAGRAQHHGPCLLAGHGHSGRLDGRLPALLAHQEVVIRLFCRKPRAW